MFIQPNTPKPHERGFVVINSDDGKELDYLHWFRVIKQTAQKYNQWYPYYGSSFSPAVSPGFMNDVDFRGDNQMRDWQYRAIANKQGEILSHSFYHAYFNFINVSQPVSSGATLIHYDFSWRCIVPGYKYTIEEGDKVETFTAKNVFENQSVELESPLQNSFTTNARIHISEESARWDAQAVIDTLAGIGIECKHHVSTWYNISARSTAWLKDYFESIVTTQIPDSRPQPIENIDLYDIKRTVDLAYFTPQLIDDILDETYDLNTVIFIQGHGWTDGNRLQNLEYIVQRTYEKGLRLIRHSDAVDYIKSVQANL